MSRTGVNINPECIEAFNSLKMKKAGGQDIKYVIYKLSDDWTEIVVEEKSEDADYEHFREKLINAKSTFKGKTGKGPRFSIYDFKVDLEQGTRTKIAFISWSPDEGAPLQAKMTYASSKESFKSALAGISTEIQANDEDELEYNSIIKRVFQGVR